MVFRVKRLIRVLRVRCFLSIFCVIPLDCLLLGSEISLVGTPIIGIEMCNTKWELEAASV